MSDGHHHGGDMGGQPGFQPGMIPSHETHHHHHHSADPSGQLTDPTDPMSPAYGRRRPGGLRYRPRPGSPAWVGLWIVRLAILAFIGYVIFQLVHGMSSAPTP
jgi:hypothetical protein